MWNYRVVRKNLAEGETSLAIYEAYYDSNGLIWAVTENPSKPYGDDINELSDDLFGMLKALERPVLDYDSLPEKGAECPIHPTQEEERKGEVIPLNPKV